MNIMFMKEVSFCVNEIKKYFNSHPLVSSVAVFLFVFLFFSIIFINSEGDPLRDDHYFHFKYAYLLRTEGLDVVKSFNWICANPDGCEGNRYPVSLFQLSLIPFTYFSDWLLALHIADAFYASIVIAIFYYVLKKFGVKNPLFFTLLLFISTFFISRILWGRAFVLITGLVFLESYFIVNKKYNKLFFLYIFHILWHQNTYFMPILITTIVEAARYLVCQKIYIRSFIVTILATVIGMAFFPGFPLSLISWVKDILIIQNGSTAAEIVIPVSGSELAIKDFMSFVNERVLLTFLVFCISVVLFLYIQQKNKGEDIFKYIKRKKLIFIYSLFIFTLIMFLGTIAISGRFFDFLIPSIFMLTAFLVTSLKLYNKIIIDKSLQKFINAFVIICVFTFSMNTIINLYSYANKFDYSPAKEAAEWISENSKKEEKIFLGNWSNFTLMFFSNHHNTYSVGIEPMSLKSYDESLYWKYYNMFNYSYYCEKQMDCRNDIEKQRELIGDDKEKGKLLEKENGKNIVESIKNDFGAKFIISSSVAFTKAVELNPDLIENKFYSKSDKYKGDSMEFTVFQLK